MYVHLYIDIHMYVNTCIHTYIHTYIHACLVLRVSVDSRVRARAQTFTDLMLQGSIPKHDAQCDLVELVGQGLREVGVTGPMAGLDLCAQSGCQGLVEICLMPDVPAFIIDFEPFTLFLNAGGGGEGRGAAFGALEV